MKRTWVFLHFIAFTFIMTLLLGCDKKDPQIKAQCMLLLKAIKSFQPLHVSAKRKDLKSQFKLAQASVLTSHKIKITDKVPDSMQEQCEGSVSLISRKTKLSHSKATMELLNAMVGLWDPHSHVLSDEENSTSLALKASYGFAIKRSNPFGLIQVDDVIAGAPAYIAGLREGMWILKINGQDVRKITTPDFNRLLNSAGQIVLKIQLPNYPSQDLTIKRKTLKTSPVKLEFIKGLESKVAYIKIRVLDGSSDIFAEMIKAAVSAESKALILDLRDNYGGHVQEALDVANYLISNGESFVGFLGRNEKILPSLKLKELGSIWDGPLIVLVNSNTKSAAEILTGALQDYGAVVVGENTFGKGTQQNEQSLYEYGMNGSLILTDSFTVRPSGQVIQNAGIVPNIKVSSNRGATTEHLLAHALPSPDLQKELEGFDRSRLISNLKSVREKFSEIELSSMITLIDDVSQAQLNAAVQTAQFLITMNSNEIIPDVGAISSEQLPTSLFLK